MRTLPPRSPLCPYTTLFRAGRYRLAGTDCVLMEVPFVGPADLLFALAEQAEAAGLTPVVAHPERAEAVLERPSLAAELAERDRKSTRLDSSHANISYAVFCL